MPGQYSKSFGNIRQPIQKYRPYIEQNLLPALNDIEVKMNTSPISTRQTSLAYSGESNASDRIVLEFYSNHADLQDYDKSEPVVFVKTYYHSKGNAAGVINLSNISEAIDLIYAALYDLGYRTSQDIKDEELEKQRAEEKKAKADAEERAKKKAELNAKVMSDIVDAEYAEENKIEEPEEEDTETEDSIEEFSIDFDRYLNVFKQRHQINDQMIISITMTNNDNYKVLSINLYYISDNMCLIQTTGINPKQDTNTTWSKAKNYAINVTKAVNGAIGVTAMNENGKDIELPPEEDDETKSNDTDVNVSL